MSKKIFAIALSLVLLVSMCLVSACDDTVESEVLNARQQAFVDAVDAIKTPITLDSGAGIDAAYNAYAFLDAYDRDSKTVAESKTLLDGYQNEYLALKQANGNQDGNNTDNAEAELVTRFLSAVEALPALDELTLADRSAINSAIAIYNRLSAQSKESKDVVAAYAKLQKVSERVTALEEAANQETWLRMADEFIDAVAELGDVTLDMGFTLDDLLYAYDNFPDGVKNIGGMAEAKAILDEKYAQYQGLKDQNDVQEFVTAVRAIGEVTLESDGAIANAERIYKYMSDNAKSKDAVIEAYEILIAARARFDELFAVVEAERIEHFIQAANKVRTDIENVDITWYDALSEARDAYWSLTYESMQLPNVKEAFERWNNAQMAFEKLGYEKIPNFSVNIAYSTDTVPFIVMQLFVENTANVREFYGVSTNAQLQQYATLYLDVYVDGVYVTKTALNMNNLVNGFILQNVNTILKGLSEQNPQIVSGANFSFAVHFEDNSGERIPTAKTSTSPTYNYTW